MAVAGYTERETERWYPAWCVIRTAIICAIVMATSWAIGFHEIWPGATATALCGVWSAASERPTRRNT